MKRRAHTTIITIGAMIGALSVHAACDDASSAVKEPPPGGSRGTDGGPGVADGSPGGNDGGGATDCFEDPKTHFEIINACTNATGIRKAPALNKLLPDGGLPPLN